LQYYWENVVEKTPSFTTSFTTFSKVSPPFDLASTNPGGLLQLFEACRLEETFNNIADESQVVGHQAALRVGVLNFRMADQPPATKPESDTSQKPVSRELTPAGTSAHSRLPAHVVSVDGVSRE